MSEVHLYPWFEQKGKMSNEHYVLSNDPNEDPQAKDNPSLHHYDQYGGRTETWNDGTWFNLHIGEPHNLHHVAQIRTASVDLENDFIALAPNEERIVVLGGKRFLFRHLPIETQ